MRSIGDSVCLRRALKCIYNSLKCLYKTKSKSASSYAPSFAEASVEEF